jgi:hypothetical protein
MLQVRRGARRRIGRVSLYVHHRSYHVYYRENGSPVRTSVGSSEPIAECTASLLNAQLVACFNAPPQYILQAIGKEIN